MRVSRRCLYIARYFEIFACSSSSAASTPAAIGATKPASVFPLTSLRSLMKSADPMAAPMCQPVPLPINLAAVKASHQDNSEKSPATSVKFEQLSE